MALQKDTVSIPLLKGINTKVDSQQEQVGGLTVLKNAKFTKIGSIAKRHGFDVLSREGIIMSTQSPNAELSYQLNNPIGLRAVGDVPIIITKDAVFKYTKANNNSYYQGSYTPLTYTSFPENIDNYIQVNSQVEVYGNFCYHLHSKTVSGTLATYLSVYDISTDTPTIIKDQTALPLNMTGTAYPNSQDAGSTFGAFSHTNAQNANGKFLIHENWLWIFVTDTSGNLFYKKCKPFDIGSLFNTAMSITGDDGGWVPVFGGNLNNTYNVYDVAEDDEGIVIAATKTVSTYNTWSWKFKNDPYYSFFASYAWTDTATAICLGKVAPPASMLRVDEKYLANDMFLAFAADNKIVVAATDEHYVKSFEYTKTLSTGLTAARFIAVAPQDNLFFQSATLNPQTTNAETHYFDVFVTYRKTGNASNAVDQIKYKDNTSGTNVDATLTVNDFDSGTNDFVRNGDWSTITFSDLEPWVTDVTVVWEIFPDSTNITTPLADFVDENWRPGVGLAGKPFEVIWGQPVQAYSYEQVPEDRLSGQWILPLSKESELQSSFYFSQLAGPQNNSFPPTTVGSTNNGISLYSEWCGILAYGIGGGDLETGTAGVPSLPPLPKIDNAVIFPYTKQSRVVTEDISSEAAAYTAFYNVEAAVVTKINYDDTIPNQSQEIADGLFIPGALVKHQSWGSASEAGFLQAPYRLYLFLGGATAMTEVSTVSPTFAKGNIYNYVAIYNDRDLSGRVYKSAISKQLQVTITNTSTNTGYDGINLLVPMNTTTDKLSSSHTVEVYRTTNNGTVFYKVSGQDSSLANPYLVNDRGNIFVAFRDTITDADLTDNELLYTTGGILENTPPPSCSIMETYKNIVFMAGLENPYAVQYTKEVGYNTALDFNDTLTFESPTVGGPITALKGMDDKLFIFKQTAIYFIAGGQNNFTSYLRTKSGQVIDIELPVLSSDIGCINKNSCVLTPIGLMFKSNRGIYLINRSNLTLEYIGAPVQAFNEENITDCTLYATDGEVRFTTERSETLVYNFERDIWYTFSNVSAKSCTVIDEKFYFANTDTNKILMESPDHYDDDGSVTPLVLETGWLSFSKVQGFQRVYRMLLLGKYKSDHQVKIKVAYDFDDTYVDEYTIWITDSKEKMLDTELNSAGDQIFSLKSDERFYSMEYGETNTDSVTGPLDLYTGTSAGTTNAATRGQLVPAVYGDPSLQFYTNNNNGTSGKPIFKIENAGQYDLGLDNTPGSLPYGDSQTGQYQFRINFKKQKCESIKISIETAQVPGETGEGATYSNLSFLVGLKKGDFRIKQSRVRGTIATSDVGVT